MGDAESRRDEARDIVAEAAEAGIPPVHWMLGHDMTTPRAICPECEQGKHDNCDGTALDPSTDDIVGCQCPRCENKEKYEAALQMAREAFDTEPTERQQLLLRAAVRGDKVVLKHTRKGPTWAIEPNKEK